MNIMSIRNAMFGAEKPRINWARDINNIEYPVSKTLKNRIDTFVPRLEAKAKKVKAEVTLAQNGDSLLINAGPRTTSVEDVSKKTDKNLYYEILDNIEANHLLKKGITP